MKQMRKYSHRNASSFSEEYTLTKEDQAAIRASWSFANERIARRAGRERCFGFFVFERIFDKVPELKELFGVAAFSRIDEVPQEHSFYRHARMLQSVLELAVRLT